jgi:hypothetical protein
MLYLHKHVYLVQLPTMFPLERVILTIAMYRMLVMSVRVESRPITFSRNETVMFTVVPYR